MNRIMDDVDENVFNKIMNSNDICDNNDIPTNNTTSSSSSSNTILNNDIISSSSSDDDEDVVELDEQLLKWEEFAIITEEHFLALERFDQMPNKTVHNTIF